MTNTDFIALVAPLVQKYAAQYGYAYPSAIIAQACLESGYGNSSLASKYFNYFGIKWYRGCGRNAVNLSTKEEYTPGILTPITSGFCVGRSADDAVLMYFEFITKNSRYNNLKQATSSRDYLERIKADGYATSTNYVKNVYAVVERYDLTQYDVRQSATPVRYAAIVTASALNVRTSPSVNAECVQVAGHNLVLPHGLCVAIDSELNGWGRLSAINGWVSLAYVNK